MIEFECNLGFISGNEFCKWDHPLGVSPNPCRNINAPLYLLLLLLLLAAALAAALAVVDIAETMNEDDNEEEEEEFSLLLKLLLPIMSKSKNK